MAIKVPPVVGEPSTDNKNKTAPEEGFWGGCFGALLGLFGTIAIILVKVNNIINKSSNDRPVGPVSVSAPQVPQPKPSGPRSDPAPAPTRATPFSAEALVGTWRGHTAYSSDSMGLTVDTVVEYKADGMFSDSGTITLESKGASPGKITLISVGHGTWTVDGTDLIEVDTARDTRGSDASDNEKISANPDFERSIHAAPAGKPLITEIKNWTGDEFLEVTKPVSDESRAMGLSMRRDGK